SPLFPYTTLFRSDCPASSGHSLALARRTRSPVASCRLRSCWWRRRWSSSFQAWRSSCSSRVLSMSGSCVGGELLADALLQAAEAGPDVAFAQAEHFRDLAVAAVLQVEQQERAVERGEPAQYALQQQFAFAGAVGIVVGGVVQAFLERHVVAFAQA